MIKNFQTPLNDEGKVEVINGMTSEIGFKIDGGIFGISFSNFE